MNKKNKNKNRSKPSNPVLTPQKAESVSAADESIVIFEEKQDNIAIESESVVETTSEVTVPVTEESNLTSETPKKPKRNKGKKKKQEDSDFDETKTDPSEVSPFVLSPSTEKIIKDEIKSEATEAKIEEDKKIDDNITPNVRKKKNKKKPNEQLKTQDPAKDTVLTESLQVFKLEEKDSLATSEAITGSPVTTEISEPETKQSKKKNKKKKHRHDSEKSDKVDETIACTSAFQKLVFSTDNEDSTSKSATVTEENKDLGNSPAGETLKDLIESVLLPEEMQESEKESMKIEPSKTKKKNKKDKKQHQQQVVEETNVLLDSQSTTQEIPFASVKDIPQDHTKDDVSEDKDLLKADNLEPLSETVTKSKAKIAKPVDKKRKGKQETREMHDNIPKFHDTQHEKENVSEDTKETANIGIISEVTDTNSQKIEEVLPGHKQDNKSTATDLMAPQESLITTEFTTTPLEIQPSVNILNSPLIETDVKIEDNIKSDEKQSLIENIETEVRGISPTSLEMVEEINKDSSGVSDVFKTVEKKRKKHLKKIDVASSTSTDKTPENKILITPDTETLKETPEKHKEEILFDLPATADVEISSIKTDDMEGSSDVTPDFIHHPLATSQQLIDDNNNMFIQEVTSMDEKLSLPLLIAPEPVIQGSGETPEPEKLLTEPDITPRERSKTNEPEKTDLKSKMMEVNQDMEELRLSIERSLAELTFMEKSESEIEKQFEKTDDPNLGIVTEPVAYMSKDNQLVEEKKSVNENVMTETINPNFIQENLDQTKILTENMELKTEELKCMSDKSEAIKTEIVEQVIPAKIEDEKFIQDVKDAPPTAPARKEHKGKGKNKRKGKQETQTVQSTSTSVSETSVPATETASQENKKEEKAEQGSQQSSEKKGKQQAMQVENGCAESIDTSNDMSTNIVDLSFEPIENFEDALTSSVDDVNKTFEMIANEVTNTPEITFQNPEINIIAPTEDTEAAKPKQNPVLPPKNLLGHPDIPVQSNRTDYKKEKNKPPNMRQAKVKIKDSMEIEKKETTKQSKESQTENRRKLSNTKNALESFSYMTNENAEYVYKYSFRKVFLQSLCHVCRKEIVQRVPCQFCSLVFYCSQKHKDEDWPQHQALCFAICTIVHLKDQKHIYTDAKHITGYNYRLLRMQMIVSCEKVLKRKLVPWEQEALLYPRICADLGCREWKQSKLADCEGCGQISYCSDHPDHLPSSHQRWCRSYALYQKLVHHQQTKGRLEPKLPTNVMAQGYKIPEKINEVLASMYDEKIDMTDTEYAALTQLATAPLTAAFCHQQAMMSNANGISKKSTFVIHIVGAELQFEAGVLHKWEVFFMHLKPDVQELKVVLISPDLNPSNLPLDLLGKVNLCDTCRADKRRVLFSFQDKKSYYEHWSSDDFFNPDIVCAFNPSIQRSSIYNGKDTWPTTVSCILKLKTPFIITSYSINELQRDIMRIKECSELAGISFKTLSDPKSNPFASVRPDRNFITDDEIPLLFKNYCFAVLCGI